MFTGGTVWILTPGQPFVPLEEQVARALKSQACRCSQHDSSLPKAASTAPTTRRVQSSWYDTWHLVDLAGAGFVFWVFTSPQPFKGWI